MLSKQAFNAPAQDARGAARACEVHLRHHRDPQGAGDGAVALPALRPAAHRDRAMLAASRRHRRAGRRGRRAGRSGAHRPRRRRLGARCALDARPRHRLRRRQGRDRRGARRCSASPTAPASSICSRRCCRATPARRCQQLAQLNRDGAEPGQVIADLPMPVHAVTLVKAAGAASADPAASEAERARAADLAARLPMPSLARAWQMLLKGHEEVRASPRPLAAADMVLVRLAYASDLPPPAELARRVRDGAGGSERDAGPAPSPKPARKPAHRSQGCPARASPPPREDSCRVGGPGARAGACARAGAAQLRRRRGARRGQARSEAEACSARAGAARAFQAGQYRAQSAASGAARPDPGADAEAQGLDRPRVDRRGER